MNFIKCSKGSQLKTLKNSHVENNEISGSYAEARHHCAYEGEALQMRPVHLPDELPRYSGPPHRRGPQGIEILRVSGQP